MADIGSEEPMSTSSDTIRTTNKRSIYSAASLTDGADEPSKKRIKTSVIHHPEHSKNDEQVTVQIENFLFKVSRNRLEIESEFFRDVFASSSVGPEIIIVSGLDPGVTPAQFSLLLKVMEDPL